MALSSKVSHFWHNGGIIWINTTRRSGTLGLDSFMNSGYTYRTEERKLKKQRENIKERKKAISEEEYQKEKQQLIEKKYMYYYNYLNSKYNGILQENDIEFFRSIKSFIDYGSETLILDMSSDEIEANIKMNFERPVEILKNDMKIILGPSNKEKTEKDTQKLEQNEEKIDEGVEK